MRNTWNVLLLVVAFIGVSGIAARADEQDEAVDRQKKRGAENWKKAFDDEPFATTETTHFIIFAAKSIELTQTKAVSETLDTYFTSMKKPLGLENKKPLWAGKMSVYLLSEKKKMNSLIRTVEKRRPTDVGQGSFYLKGEQSHVAVCAPSSKEEPDLVTECVNQFVQALITRFAGDGNGIPDWLLQGLVGAAVWQTAEGPAAKKRDAERKEVLSMVNNPKNPKNLKDLFAGTLSGREQTLVRTSLAEFLAYGPTQDKFPELLRAFKPERRGEAKNIDSVLTTIDQNPLKLNRAWIRWVRDGSK